MKTNLKNTVLKASAFLLFFSVFIFNSFSQCSMCKAVLESNLESGESALGKGINDGIIYLMAFPYLLFGIVAYFLYKHYKKQQTTA